MPEPISLHPATSNAVHLASVRSASPSGLPPDLLDDVARRLSFAALIIIVVLPTNLIVAELTEPSLNRTLEYTNAIISLSVSLLVLYLARTNKIPPTGPSGSRGPPRARARRALNHRRAPGVRSPPPRSGP